MKHLNFRQCQYVGGVAFSLLPYLLAPAPPSRRRRRPHNQQTLRIFGRILSCQASPRIGRFWTCALRLCETPPAESTLVASVGVCGTTYPASSRLPAIEFIRRAIRGLAPKSSGRSSRRLCNFAARERQEGIWELVLRCGPEIAPPSRRSANFWTILPSIPSGWKCKANRRSPSAHRSGGLTV